ncbi:hypothetical protein P3T73_09540 [Kiritimatiellota bacterium B12222]|nr:hypothetical protein P3T73_09540 [Kiritimatiellota bacterium B12222]
MKPLTHTLLLASLLPLAPLFAQNPEPSPNPQSPRAEQQGQGRKKNHMVDHYLEKLKNETPEEYERLKTLRQENPQAFRLELRQKAYNKGAGGRRSVSQRGPHPLQEHIDAVKNADSPEAKQAAIVTLRAKIAEQVENNLAEREVAIEKFRKRLKQLEAQNENERAHESEIIDHHLQRLLKTIDQPTTSPPSSE